MVHFLTDIDLRFVRDNEYLSFTNAKPYQSTKDYKRLLESCKKNVINHNLKRGEHLNNH